MKSKVFIKSFSNGINVHLDPDISFEELLNQVEKRFRDSASFFKNARMALSFEGRDITEDEELKLFDRIGLCCDLEIVCIIGHDDQKDQTYIRAIQKVDEHFEEESGSKKRRRNRKRACEIYRYSIRERERIEFSGNVLILGDVNGGSCVMAQGDIIVMGGLYGEAHGGLDLKDGHFIAALELSPDALSINDIEYINPNGSDNWPIKSRPFPRVAFLQDDEVIVEHISRELWEELSGYA